MKEKIEWYKRQQFLVQRLEFNRFLTFEIFGMNGHTKFAKIDETGFKSINNRRNSF